MSNLAFEYPNVRVLMLEDNPDDAALIMRKLATVGLKIESDVVRSAREFMEHVGARRYDLILSDFTLPGWNGLEALRWVRKSGHDVPFIYVSGTLGEEVAVEAIREGATDYILKNNLARLPHAVTRALEELRLRRSKERIEREKQDSEKQYRLLFENNPQPMWVFDRNTLRFLAVNDAAVAHYGYTRDEFMGMTLLDIPHQAEIQTVLRSVLQKDTQGQRVKESRTHRKKNGDLIEVEVYRNSVTFEGVPAMLALLHDVTELRKSERKLKLSEEKFSKAFRSCPLPISITTKADGRYVEINDAFLEMMGYSREDAIGRSAVEMGIWDSPDDRKAIIDALDRNGRVSAFETTFNTRGSKKRTVQITAEILQLEDDPCVIAITSDITEARALEEQFRHAQKMEAVGRLAGGMAHDFNNMLSVIMGYCDLAQSHSEREILEKDVAHIKESAQRAAKLTAQLLAFSRQQVVRPCVLNLNKVVRDVFQMLHRVIAADVELKFEQSASLGNVKADLGNVEQILMNLVVNARDALPKGGKILIETSNVEIDALYTKLHPKVQPGPYVVLTVSDNGIGMSAEVLAKVFEPFFTTKSAGTGTGLGLSMVYGAMQRAGGHITVYSEEGKGTTFRLYFPRIEEELQSPFLAEIPETLARGSETVLLVEDEDNLREVTTELLQGEGYTVLEAPNPEAALSRAREHNGVIDLLVTDVMLPGMNGRDLAERIRQSRSGVKVLFMSGYTGALIATEGVLEPGAALVCKPFTKRELLQHVRAVLTNS